MIWNDAGLSFQPVHQASTYQMHEAIPRSGLFITHQACEGLDGVIIFMPLDPYDYVRIRAQLDFQCLRCGVCCQVADPIDLYPKDIRRLASYFNISLEEAVLEYTIPHPSEPDLRAFKATAPCRFYDDAQKGCKIYQARPMVCRCSPFLSPGQIGLQGVEIYEDCPASERSLKRIERDLDSMLDPDAKTRKGLEKALAKMMQIE